MQEVIEDISAILKLMAYGFGYLVLCGVAGLAFVGILMLITYLTTGGQP